MELPLKSENLHALPLHKRGDKNHLKNYWPEELFCLAKVQESSAQTIPPQTSEINIISSLLLLWV